MRILSKRQVKELVLYSPQHTARLEKAGLFPKRVQLGPNRVGYPYVANNAQTNLRNKHEQPQIHQTVSRDPVHFLADYSQWFFQPNAVNAKFSQSRSSAKSFTILRFLTIKYSTKSIKMLLPGVARIVFPLPCSLFRDFGRQNLQGPSRPAGFQVCFTGAFEVVEFIKRTGDTFCGGHNPMIAHDQDALVAQNLRKPFAFIGKAKPAKPFIIRISIEETRSILVDGRQRSML